MTTLTEHFGLDPYRLHVAGALDVPLQGGEARMYMDPRLLRRSAQPEFAGAMDDVARYYQKTLGLVASASQHKGKARTKLLAAAKARFLAPELSGLPLGYGQTGGHGRGIGSKTAEQMLGLSQELVECGLDDPELFELFSVVEEGIGADLIGDLIAHISRDRLYAFSERVANDLRLPIIQLEAADRSYRLPLNPFRDAPLVLPPHDAVADIVAFQQSQRFDKASFSNDAIREAFDECIKKSGTAGLREFLLKHRQAREELLTAYRRVAPSPHDVYADPGGTKLAGREVYEAIQAHAEGPSEKPETAHSLFLEIVSLAERFKHATEAGSFRTQLHSPSGPRKEADVQGIFSNCVRFMCEDRDIKVSAEADNGVGPADFVFDRGESKTVVLEVKMTTSTKLVENYDHQVEAYKKSHGALHGIYLVVDLVGKESRAHKLTEHHDAKAGDPNRPYLVLVDAREGRPASKRTKALEPFPDVRCQPCVTVAMTHTAKASRT